MWSLTLLVLFFKIKDLTMLSKLRAAVLPKVGAMKTFPVIKKSVLAFLASLDAYLPKVEATEQVIHHLLLLHFSDALTKLLS